ASDGAHRVGGAADRRLGKLGGMREAGRLARQRAQAEALRGIEGRALDAAIVEGDAFRLAVFEIELAVIHAVERFRDDRLDTIAIHAGVGEKQRVGAGEVGHSHHSMGEHRSPGFYVAARPLGGGAACPGYRAPLAPTEAVRQRPRAGDRNGGEWPVMRHKVAMLRLASSRGGRYYEAVARPVPGRRGVSWRSCGRSALCCRVAPLSPPPRGLARRCAWQAPTIGSRSVRPLSAIGETRGSEGMGFSTNGMVGRACRLGAALSTSIATLLLIAPVAMAASP